MRKVYFGNELYHHGVMGMKWGVRRYQNTDGSYKASAEGRYDPEPESKSNEKHEKALKNERTAKRYLHKSDKRLDRERKDMKKWKFKGQLAYGKYKDKAAHKPGSRADRKLRKITEKYLAKREKYYNDLADNWSFENDAKKKGYQLKSNHNFLM